MRSNLSLLIPVMLLLSSTLLADPPPSNTIPIISMKTGQDATCDDITLDVLCMLLWHNFDGIWAEGWLTGQVADPASYCDSTDAVMVLSPGRLQSFNWPPERWGRFTIHPVGNSRAFMHPDPDDFKYIDSYTLADSIIKWMDTKSDLLHTYASEHPCIWYYDVFNEAPAWQLSAMFDDTSSIDDYFPSVFTQDTSMTQILPDGIFSWVKWKSDSLYSSGEPTLSICFSMLHTLEDSVWGGLSPGFHLGTDTTQAHSVRAYFNTRYLQYSPSSLTYDTIPNTPERMDLNTYPVRLAGYHWQTITADSITVLGSATDLWMLQHYEHLMDSTFIPAGTHENGPFPIHYHPQAFGRTGGNAIWAIDTTSTPPDTTIQYGPYSYRIPSPAEFRMLCNIGLLRGAKGVFPYSLRSYNGWNEGELIHHDTGLLDENLIPFDAPYEDWVYRDRPTADFYYAPPDSIPPWTAADHSQFDPLYTVPSRPILVPGSQRNRENYLMWKFGPYGRLWNSVRGTFREIAWVAPELSQLWWWFSGDRYDNATIDYDGTEPQYFADPHIRVFTNSDENTCYLYYVNRFCRANDNPFEITIGSSGFPSGVPFSEYALDHSRRFLIEGSETTATIYDFTDTLDAGQARLLQMFNGTRGLDADLRITDPDMFVIIPADEDTLTDNTSTVRTGFDIYGWVYNMGTEPERNVKVWLEDITTDTVRIDSVYLSFDGLSTSSCYQPDRTLASFDTTITPGPSDIGVHIYRIHVEPLSGEPDTLDNSASLVYMVRPRDYATEVLDDPWDMTEATSSPPVWKTDDIVSMTGWNTTFTDSISGMFEGTITSPSSTNRMVLNTGSGSSNYIDTSLYENITIAGKAEMILDIKVCWLDEHSDTLHADLGVDLDTAWTEIGPVSIQDINPVWDDEKATKFWLQFSHSTSVSPTDVRIGWIRLTEKEVI